MRNLSLSEKGNKQLIEYGACEDTVRLLGSRSLYKQDALVEQGLSALANVGHSWVLSEGFDTHQTHANEFVGNFGKRAGGLRVIRAHFLPCRNAHILCLPDLRLLRCFTVLHK